MSSLKKKSSSGFSLLELIIAMAITMILVTAATTLLASGLRMRTRENQKSDALADTQRALNIMSREIANAGFNLSNNGIVVADSGANKIRVRSNLNRYENDNQSLSDISRNTVATEQEDITYYLNEAENTKYLVRHDEFGTGSTVLANRIDSLNFYYFDQKVDYTAPSGGSGEDIDFSAPQVSKENAKYIVIAISVTLDAVGSPGTEGYQPGHSVLLCSDVMLRNWDLRFY
jgi:type II secretory pathway pseudopilin PulG